MKHALIFLWKATVFIYFEIKPFLQLGIAIVVGLLTIASASIWFFLLWLAFLALEALTKDLIEEHGFRVNLGFWKFEIEKHRQRNLFLEHSEPITNEVHREILRRGGNNPDDFRVVK